MAEPDATTTHDLPAERAVLGAMLANPGDIPEIVGILVAGDFYQPRHGVIFDAIIDAHADGATGTIHVHRRMLDAGTLGHGLEAGYLADLDGQAPPARAGATYARTVAELSGRRRVILAARRTAAAANEPGVSAERLASLADEMVRAAQPRDIGGDMVPLGDLIASGLNDIEHRANRDRGVRTGFSDLDRLLGGGLRPGQMIVIAGRPGMGKSTVAMDIARNAAIARKLTVAVFSLEMATMELFDRIVSAEARIPHHVLVSGNLGEDDWTRSTRAADPMSKAPLWLHCRKATIRQIQNKCATLKAREGALDLVVIDYLGLVPVDRRYGSREQEVASVSTAIKGMAMDLEVPVIAVHQLNRESEKRTDRRPQLSDLRDSGSVEQDADVVIFVYRDDYYDKESARAGEADLIVAKHRGGPTDTVTVAAQLHYSRFVDMATG